jgi:hypothetical protein
VLVTGQQPGPPLWKVTSGDHVLWILAEVRMVPSKLKWRSKQVEKVLKDAREVLAIYGGEEPARTAEEKAAQNQRSANSVDWGKRRELPAGQTLRDILSPDQYALFDTVRARFAKGDKTIERITPSHAQSRLGNNAMRDLKIGLSPVTDKVVKMAKRRKVKVTRVQPLYWRGPPAPTSDEQLMNTCPLQSLLVELSDGGARWKARANAWSTGDVDRLRAVMQPIRVQPIAGPCGEGSAVGEAPQPAGQEDPGFTGVWPPAAERALKENASTLAVVEFAELVRPGGLLEFLRSRGYEVLEP